jgi:hypothetical protein
MKKYTFKIFYFNEKTREVEVFATYKTKPITEERLPELIRIEMSKCKSPCCYQVVGR